MDIQEAFPKMPEDEWDHLVDVMEREIAFAWLDDRGEDQPPAPPTRAAIAALGVLQSHGYLSPPAFDSTAD
jgi:hypothetical protein